MIKKIFIQIEEPERPQSMDIWVRSLENGLYCMYWFCKQSNCWQSSVWNGTFEYCMEMLTNKFTNFSKYIYLT